MKEPIHIPNLQVRCEQCDQVTGTKILFMKAGLGNSCAVCGKFRKGKPYLSQRELIALEPNMAKGKVHDEHTRYKL